MQVVTESVLQTKDPIRALENKKFRISKHVYGNNRFPLFNFLQDNHWYVSADLSAIDYFI